MEVAEFSAVSANQEVDLLSFNASDNSSAFPTGDGEASQPSDSAVQHSQDEAAVSSFSELKLSEADKVVQLNSAVNSNHEEQPIDNVAEDHGHNAAVNHSGQEESHAAAQEEPLPAPSAEQKAAVDTPKKSTGPTKIKSALPTKPATPLAKTAPPARPKTATEPKAGLQTTRTTPPRAVPAPKKEPAAAKESGDAAKRTPRAASASATKRPTTAGSLVRKSTEPAATTKKTNDIASPSPSVSAAPRAASIKSSHLRSTTTTSASATAKTPTDVTKRPATAPATRKSPPKASEASADKPNTSQSAAAENPTTSSATKTPTVNKDVRSKIGSLDNATRKPAGGNIKIFSTKLNFKHVQSRCGTFDNMKHKPGGGAVRVSDEARDKKATDKGENETANGASENPGAEVAGSNNENSAANESGSTAGEYSASVHANACQNECQCDCQRECDCVGLGKAQQQAPQAKCIESLSELACTVPDCQLFFIPAFSKTLKCLQSSDEKLALMHALVNFNLLLAPQLDIAVFVARSYSDSEADQTVTTPSVASEITARLDDRDDVQNEQTAQAGSYAKHHSMVRSLPLNNENKQTKIGSYSQVFTAKNQFANKTRARSQDSEEVEQTDSGGHYWRMHAVQATLPLQASRLTFGSYSQAFDASQQFQATGRSRRRRTDHSSTSVSPPRASPSKAVRFKLKSSSYSSVHRSETSSPALLGSTSETRPDSQTNNASTTVKGTPNLSNGQNSGVNSRAESAQSELIAPSGTSQLSQKSNQLGLDKSPEQEAFKTAELQLQQPQQVPVRRKSETERSRKQDQELKRQLELQKQQEQEKKRQLQLQEQVERDRQLQEERQRALILQEEQRLERQRQAEEEEALKQERKLAEEKQLELQREHDWAALVNRGRKRKISKANPPARLGPLRKLTPLAANTNTATSKTVESTDLLSQSTDYSPDDNGSMAFNTARPSAHAHSSNVIGSDSVAYEQHNRSAPQQSAVATSDAGEYLADMPLQVHLSPLRNADAPAALNRSVPLPLKRDSRVSQAKRSGQHDSVTSFTSTSTSSASVRKQAETAKSAQSKMASGSRPLNKWSRKVSNELQSKPLAPIIESSRNKSDVQPESQSAALNNSAKASRPVTGSKKARSEKSLPSNSAVTRVSKVQSKRSDAHANEDDKQSVATGVSRSTFTTQKSSTTQLQSQNFDDDLSKLRASIEQQLLAQDTDQPQVREIATSDMVSRLLKPQRKADPRWNPKKAARLDDLERRSQQERVRNAKHEYYRQRLVQLPTSRSVSIDGSPESDTNAAPLTSRSNPETQPSDFCIVDWDADGENIVLRQPRMFHLTALPRIASNSPSRAQVSPRTSGAYINEVQVQSIYPSSFAERANVQVDYRNAVVRASRTEIHGAAAKNENLPTVWNQATPQKQASPNAQSPSYLNSYFTSNSHPFRAPRRVEVITDRELARVSY